MEYALSQSHESSNTTLSSWDALDSEKKPKRMPDYPKHWKWQAEHFNIARRLSDVDAKWLRSLPMTLNSECIPLYIGWGMIRAEACVLPVPDLHAWVVHAGLLSSQAPIKSFELPETMNSPFTPSPTNLSSPSDKDTEDPFPLTSLSTQIFLPSKHLSTLLSSSAKTSVLMQLQNRDPYTLTEMRGVRHSGSEPTKKNKGKKWFRLWNDAMKHCQDPAPAQQLWNGGEQDKEENDDESNASESNHKEAQKTCEKQNVM